MVAIEIVYLLSRIAPPRLRREFQRYDLQQWQSRSLRWCRAPGCFRCRPLAPMHLNHGSTHAAPRLTDTAIVFEDYIGLQSRDASSAQKDEARADASRSLIRQNKILANCSQISLGSQMPKLDCGVLDPLLKNTRPSSKTLTRDQLGCLLMLTAGIRDTGNGQVQRWGATGGNLGSVELYLAVRRVSGLAPGFYFYQPFDHSLALFQRRSGALDIESFMQHAILAGANDLPDVLILFTSAFHRVSKKYGVFGYRLVNLDAGAAISQLHLAARSMNIFSRTATSWADDLIAEQLNLDSPREHSTAVVALSGTVNHATELQANCAGDSKVRPGQPPSAKPLRDFCDIDVEELFQMLYRESRVQKDELDRGTFFCPAELLLANDFTSTCKLPSPRNCGRSAGEVLAQRRSIRRYAPASISAEQLGTMLYSAHHGDAYDWPVEHHNMQPLTFFALVSNVEGLNPGIYQYRPQDHGLQLCASSPNHQDMQELFVQAEFAAAPLVIWIAGNLAAACAQHGAPGHRQLLLRAGAAGHRLWMAALAMDLAGVLVAGLVPGAARRQFGLDGYKQASLLAFVAGHPARYRMQPLIHNGAVGAQDSQR
jgi:SagB-type dehydrogenase family enzyme